MKRIWQSLQLFEKTQAYNPKTYNSSRRIPRRLIVHLNPPYLVFHFSVFLYFVSAVLLVLLPYTPDFFHIMCRIAFALLLLTGSYLCWCSYRWARNLCALIFDGGDWYLLGKDSQKYEIQIKGSMFFNHFLLVLSVIRQDHAVRDKYIAKSLILSPSWIDAKEYRRLSVLLWLNLGESNEA